MDSRSGKNGIAPPNLHTYGRGMIRHAIGNISGVILAAGLSRRAGAFKPTALVGKTPLLLHAVEGLLGFCSDVVVVVGHERERAEALIQGRNRVSSVFNPRFRDDMFYSVQIGAGAVPVTSGAFFVLPVDCPLDHPLVLQAMLDSRQNDRAVVPTHEGRGGHPVLLPARARAMILESAPPTTLRDIVSRIGSIRVVVDSPSILLDLDKPADFEKP